MIYGLMCPTSRLFAAAVLAASEVVLRPQDIDIAVMRNFMWNVGRMGRIQDSFQRISQISEDFTDFTNIGFDMFLGIDLPSRTAEGVSTSFLQSDQSHCHLPRHPVETLQDGTCRVLQVSQT